MTTLNVTLEIEIEADSEWTELQKEEATISLLRDQMETYHRTYDTGVHCPSAEVVSSETGSHDITPLEVGK